MGCSSSAPKERDDTDAQTSAASNPLRAPSGRQSDAASRVPGETASKLPPARPPRLASFSSRGSSALITMPCGVPHTPTNSLPRRSSRRVARTSLDATWHLAAGAHVTAALQHAPRVPPPAQSTTPPAAVP